MPATLENPQSKKIRNLRLSEKAIDRISRQRYDVNLHVDFLRCAANEQALAPMNEVDGFNRHKELQPPPNPATTLIIHCTTVPTW